jgi:hypothetical protein
MHCSRITMRRKPRSCVRSSPSTAPHWSGIATDRGACGACATPGPLRGYIDRVRGDCGTEPNTSGLRSWKKGQSGNPYVSDQLSTYGLDIGMGDAVS